MNKLLFIVGMLMLCCSTSTMAYTAPLPSDACSDIVQTSRNLDLSEAQITKLKSTCESVATTADTNSFNDRVKSIGESIGIAIGSTAKQLNIAVNDFVKSPAGIITISLIVAKMFGAGIVKFFLLFFAWYILIKAYIWFIKRIFEYKVEYQVTPVLFGLWMRKKAVNVKYKSLTEFTDGCYGMLVVSSMIMLVASAILIANAL